MDQRIWHNDGIEDKGVKSFHGSVRMMIPCEPWRLSLQLSAIEISQSWVRASLHRKAFERYFVASDVDEVFRIGRQFDIQVEADEDYLPQASVSAELFTRDIHSQGIVMQFNFLQSAMELEELLRDLPELPRH